MSYGREPHYIYSCACGGGEGDEDGLQHPTAPHDVIDFAPVPRTAIEQFVATLHWRGELAEVIGRGYALRPELRRDEARTPPFAKPHRGHAL